MVTFDFDTESYMAVVLHTRRIRVRTPKPILIFLMLAEPSWNDSVALKEAEDRMRKLLTEADAPAIPTIHGVCVSGTRVTFYRYEWDKGLFMPESGQVHFDLDLKEENGAARVLEVAEDIKRMCRALIGKLKY